MGNVKLDSLKREFGATYYHLKIDDYYFLIIYNL